MKPNTAITRKDTLTHPHTRTLLRRSICFSQIVFFCCIRTRYSPLFVGFKLFRSLFFNHVQCESCCLFVRQNVRKMRVPESINSTCRVVVVFFCLFFCLFYQSFFQYVCNHSLNYTHSHPLIIYHHFYYLSI